MDRRDFLKRSVLAAASLSLPGLGFGALKCGYPDRYGIKLCEAGINSYIANQTAAAVGGQHLNQWCWAACIEMVFRYYGYRVPQARIVAETWGEIQNLPAQPYEILQNLNRPWIDDAGYRFRVTGNTYSANHKTAAQDLAADKPLIIGTLGHAMLLTSLTYYVDPYGEGEVKLAKVRDPMPGYGLRTLSAIEWYSTSFLARIRVFSY